MCVQCGAGDYASALLKAFSRTLDERRHSVAILDAPNPRAADYREFWRAGQVRQLPAGWPPGARRPAQPVAPMQARLLDYDRTREFMRRHCTSSVHV